MFILNRATCFLKLKILHKHGTRNIHLAARRKRPYSTILYEHHLPILAKFYCFAFRSIGSEDIFHPSACKRSRQDANIRRLHRCDVRKRISNGNCDSSFGSAWHDIIILFRDEMLWRTVD